MLSLEDFKKIELDDYKKFKNHYSKYPPLHSDNLFTTLISWMEYSDYHYTFYKDNLIIYGESDTIKYGGLFQLCCPVDTDEAKSTYKNGLLKIEVPYLDALKDTVEIEIK